MKRRRTVKSMQGTLNALQDELAQTQIVANAAKHDLEKLRLEHSALKNLKDDLARQLIELRNASTPRYSVHNEITVKDGGVVNMPQA